MWRSADPTIDHYDTLNGTLPCYLKKKKILFVATPNCELLFFVVFFYLATLTYGVSTMIWERRTMRFIRRTGCKLSGENMSRIGSDS